MGKVTTHVLDTMFGCPANGMELYFFRYDKNGVRTNIFTGETNKDGRTNEPLVSAVELIVGRYGLSFCVGKYFHSKGVVLEKPSFLDVVTLDFGISDNKSNLHIPLLVSPYSYSTYRGS